MCLLGAFVVLSEVPLKLVIEPALIHGEGLVIWPRDEPPPEQKKFDLLYLTMRGRFGRRTLARLSLGLATGAVYVTAMYLGNSGYAIAVFVGAYATLVTLRMAQASTLMTPPTKGERFPQIYHSYKVIGRKKAKQEVRSFSIEANDPPPDSINAPPGNWSGGLAQPCNLEA